MRYLNETRAAARIFVWLRVRVEERIEVPSLRLRMEPGLESLAPAAPHGAVARMAKAIWHRGPDEDGFLFDGAMGKPLRDINGSPCGKIGDRRRRVTPGLAVPLGPPDFF